MILRSEIAQRVFETPLLMHPGKAVAVLAAIGGRVVEGGVEIPAGVDLIDHVAFQNGRPSMGRLADRIGRAHDVRGLSTFDIIDNVAVIPIEGTLVHKGTYVGMSSGRTSYEGLQAQIRRAGTSSSIRGVVFEVDSFGGEAAGAFETAKMIRELSEVKPTLAILTDNAASSAFLLAAGARQIVMPAQGRVGSIGVMVIHLDLSQKLENDGVKVTLLTAGAHKEDLSPFRPLPEDQANKIRRDIELTRQDFAQAVGRGRGARFTAQQALDTEADVFRGDAAAGLGLVDAVGNPNETFDEFIRAVNG